MKMYPSVGSGGPPITQAYTWILYSTYVVVPLLNQFIHRYYTVVGHLITPAYTWILLQYRQLIYQSPWNEGVISERIPTNL